MFSTFNRGAIALMVIAQIAFQPQIITMQRSRVRKEASVNLEFANQSDNLALVSYLCAQSSAPSRYYIPAQTDIDTIAVTASLIGGGVSIATSAGFFEAHNYHDSQKSITLIKIVQKKYENELTWDFDTEQTIPYSPKIIIIVNPNGSVSLAPKQ